VKRRNVLEFISRLARVADDRKERIGGITGLEEVLSSRDLVAPRGFRVSFDGLVSSIGVVGVAGELSVWNANCCCANAHSVVEVFDVRGGSTANDR